METENKTPEIKNFIEQKIEQDITNNIYGGNVYTRFPPEPNGFLHIGHAKSIVLNFSLAKKYNGKCNLRFDDTNPIKEEEKYMHAIKEDIAWLGFSWDKLEHTANYFDKLFNYAIEFIKKNKAYVCSLCPEEIRQYRGTLKEPGKNSPYRNRTVEENLDLFYKMKNGEFKDGEHVLRAKIDMGSPNLNMRDPVMYRILHAKHQHTSDQWCIYPMYDYAHCFSDALENITHSICTLEFQDHRPLYNWFLEQVLEKPLPQQIEFSRLNVSHTLTSKRNLKKLVDENIVNDWDDPRMPTISGMRKRGFTPTAIKKFCEMVGISKSDSIIDLSLLEEAVRDDLNTIAPRVMCVLNPLKVTITNLDDNYSEILTALNHPQKEELGKRNINFSNTIYIERSDFEETPPKKYKRLTLDKEVRLRNSYILKCNEIIKDNNNHIIELKCTIDKNTLGKNPEDRKVKGVIHWVCAKTANKCQVNLYDRLFTIENPAKTESFEELLTHINPDSLKILDNCLIEANIPSKNIGSHFQFERNGYFIISSKSEEKLIFNRVIALQNNWT